METIVLIHSHLRHLVFAFGVIVLLVALVPTIRRTPLPRFGRILFRLFLWLLSAQMLLGIIQLIARWDTFGDAVWYRFFHGLTMIAAISFGHLGLRYTKRTDRQGARYTLYVVVCVFAMVLGGILILPHGRYLLGL